MISTILQNKGKQSSTRGKTFQTGRLIALLMLLFAFTGVMKAGTEVEIPNSGSYTTSNYSSFPINTGNSYSLSQQIYTADEIGFAGDIMSIQFGMNNQAVARYIKVYMKHVDKNSFISNYDWVAIDEDDLVYDGIFAFNEYDWSKITLDKSFEYNGEDNLLICVYDYSGYANSYSSFYSFNNYSYTYRTKYYSQGSAFDLSNLASQYGYYSTYYRSRIILEFTNPAVLVANVVEVAMGERPNGSWMRPSTFTLTNIGNYDGTITAITTEEAYFVIENELPLTVAPGESVEIELSTTTAVAGDVQDILTIAYNDSEADQTLEIPVLATAYDPVAGDVWENPIDLDVVSTGYDQYFQLGTEYTQEPCPYHNVYELPDSNLDMKDVVFKFTVEEDFRLYYEEYGGTNKIAVYAEDFGGLDGPTPTNSICSGDYNIDRFFEAGTYYIVADDSDDAYRECYVNIQQVDVPYYSWIENEYGQSWDYSTNVENGDIMKIYVGDNSAEMQVLVGTQYPPTTVMVDWMPVVPSYFDNNTFQNTYTYIPVEGLVHNAVYFAQVKTRNSSGVTSSQIYPFTSFMDQAANFTVDNDTVWAGDNVTFTWDAMRPVFLGYNFYMNGEKLNDELLTATTYTVENLDYNPYGYEFALTTVYEAGESVPDPVMVYVGGYAIVRGHVYEQDGTTPINNIGVTVTGIDEFGSEVEYTFTTDEEGAYTGTVKCGYNFVAGIDNVAYSYEEQNIGYLANGWEVTGIDFVLTETYFPVATVTAVEQGENVKIDWTTETREFQNFRVYRTLYTNNGPFTAENTDLIAETTELTALDETWADAEDGKLYKYGVSCVYAGNREASAPYEFSEGFDEGLPDGWSLLDPYNFGYNWMLGSEAGLGYYKGHNGSKDMMISKSYDGGQSVDHENYLVTPKVSFAELSEFSFWACAQDEHYPTEYFSVLVSTAGPNVGDFVEVAYYTMTAKGQGNWYQYTVGLSQFAGNEGYIAICHYNWGGQDGFYLDIDDVELRNPTILVDGESEIVWSEPMGKDMMVDGTISVRVDLNNPDESPAGAKISFVNLVEYEQENYPVADVIITEDMVVEEDNYYYAVVEYTNFRKGDYTLQITRKGYNAVNEYLEIYEAGEYAYTMYENIAPAEMLSVSHTGWATWDILPEEGDRAFMRYYVNCNGYGSYVYDNYFQIPANWYLIEGNTYDFNVQVQYTTGWSYSVYTTFTYEPCSNYPIATNFQVSASAEGNILTWTNPESMPAEVMVGDTDEYSWDNSWDFPDWAQKFPAGTISSDEITKISYFNNYNSGYVNRMQFFVYNGGEDAPDNLIYTSEVVTMPSVTRYIDHEFDTPLAIDNTQNLWVVCRKISGTYWAACVKYNANLGNNGFYSWNGGETWEPMSYYMGDNYCFKIRVYTPDTLYTTGVAIYSNGNFYDIAQGESYVDEGIFGAYDYAIRVIWPGNDMSCMLEAEYGVQNTQLYGGWNWWSTFISQENYDGLGILEQQLGENGIMIKSQEGSVSYDEESGEWSGSLTALNNQSMYKIQMSNEAVVTMVGQYDNYEEDTITLYNGWTYIGYTMHWNANLDEALANLNATDGDIIKSQDGFATYDAEGGWFGSIPYMSSGYGYMYKSMNEEEVKFTYTVSDKNVKSGNEFMAKHWVANMNAYANNMTIMAVVELDDVEVAGDYELASFANGECRGSVKLVYIPTMGRHVAFLTVAGDEAAELRFALYNTVTEEEIFECNTTAVFSANAMYGDKDNPAVISFRGNTGVSELSNSMTVYPNPVQKGGNVTITLAEETEMQVEVINTIGEVVSVENYGMSHAVVTMPEIPGIYMIRIVTGNNSTMFRKVVVE